jgi:hypothetical protein
MLTVQIFGVALIAGLSTWYLNHHLQRGPILASAVITLTAGLLLPNLFEQGATLAAIAACASYVSMSANIRLRNSFETAIALLLAAWLFTMSANIFVGVGGKLGTIAAISVMTVWGYTEALKLMPKQRAVAAKIYSRIL